jgi:hypothetical protein
MHASPSLCKHIAQATARVSVLHRCAWSVWQDQSTCCSHSGLSQHVGSPGCSPHNVRVLHGRVQPISNPQIVQSLTCIPIVIKSGGLALWTILLSTDLASEDH